MRDWTHGVDSLPDKKVLHHCFTSIATKAVAKLRLSERYHIVLMSTSSEVGSKAVGGVGEELLKSD
jgi:hypothetical protein